MCITKREKAESEAQRGKPKGTLESDIRSAISLLGQRPPRYTGSVREDVFFPPIARCIPNREKEIHNLQSRINSKARQQKTFNFIMFTGPSTGLDARCKASVNLHSVLRENPADSASKSKTSFKAVGTGTTVLGFPLQSRALFLFLSLGSLGAVAPENLG